MEAVVQEVTWEKWQQRAREQESDVYQHCQRGLLRWTEARQTHSQAQHITAGLLKEVNKLVEMKSLCISHMLRLKTGAEYNCNILH